MSFNPEADHWKTQRVYLSNGAKVVHLIPAWASPSSMEPALCGQNPAHWNGWMGTGTQDEHEKAAAMAICLNCERVKRGKDHQ